MLITLEMETFVYFIELIGQFIALFLMGGFFHLKHTSYGGAL